MKIHYKKVFISDVHLGTRGCQADTLESFLDSISCDELYLVGDIIDGWVMSQGKFYWPQSHSNVVRKILSKSRKNTKVIYITGNHDEFLRENIEMQAFGNIIIADEYICKIGDKTFLVKHGDQYDIITRYHKWVALLGDFGYRFLLYLNRQLNKVRQKSGKGYWSLSAYVKYKVKSAVQFIGEYEKSVVFEARKHNVDGVICGHIHHAEIKEIDNILYINCGDWVESCTAIVETEDSEIKLIKYHQ
jgi:UDP-2,3-diacylglucosamine pyrophosphatase LpxH